MLNKELEFSLNIAFKEAKEKRHEFMTVEHLLLSLLDNPAAGNVLQACHANIELLRVPCFVIAAKITSTVITF